MPVAPADTCPEGPTTAIADPDPVAPVAPVAPPPPPPEIVIKTLSCPLLDEFVTEETPAPVNPIFHAPVIPGPVGP